MAESDLQIRLTTAMSAVQELLRQIREIEANTQLPANERLLLLKNIRVELNKVGTEIDSIKKEIKLLDRYRLN